jgi:hypothetical protein
MCYDGCQHHVFNPMTGNDWCTNNSGYCPGEEPEDDEENEDSHNHA